MLMLAVVGMLACSANYDADHDHGAGSHSHGAGEAESWAVTAWGEQFELFPEIDALVAGETAGAHVHVTVLDRFQPATEGTVTITLTDAEGVQERFSSTNVIRPGIFNVEIQPDEVGERELSFEVEVDGERETIAGGTVNVGSHGTPGGLIDPPHLLPQSSGGEEVDFLKEQQWRTTFATEWAGAGVLASSVTGTARVQPASDGEVVLTAPVDGVVRAAAWPFTGKATVSGEPLMELIPTAPAGPSLAELEALVLQLEALSNAAGARLERLESLLAKEAVSRREVEQAQAEATGLAARLQAGRADLAAAEAGRRGKRGPSGLKVSAPFAGRIAETLVSPGEHVAAGAMLIRVIRERPVWIRVALTPEDARRLDDGISGLILDIGATTAPVKVMAGELRLVAVAPEVDSRSGTVEALIEVQRNVDDLKPGLRATAQVLLAREVRGLVLPDSAVIDDAGVPVVYVQLGGESFVRREVELQQRQGDKVLVNGVRPGERVVTIGGAAIRRASLLASGAVHGHVH
jgi:RND family efflux transporter MFP subunit